MTDKTPSARELQRKWRKDSYRANPSFMDYGNGVRQGIATCAENLEPLCVREERDVELIRRLAREVRSGPHEMYSGVEVYKSMTPEQLSRNNPNTVSDVLDALAKLYKTDQDRAALVTEARERVKDGGSPKTCSCSGGDSVLSCPEHGR